MLRLDVYLVEKGYFETREKAQAAIRDGLVKVKGELVTKPSRKVSDEEEIEIGEGTLKYVSRGGLKLERAVEMFQIDLNEKRVLDVGASTGGFTDVALQNGADMVYAMDVGTDQLHPSLRQNEKVRSIENCHIRDFTLAHTDNEQVDVVVTDVSFISLTQVLPYFKAFLCDKGEVVALIKPQFELTEKLFIKNGIVKDFKHHVRAIEQVFSVAIQEGLFLKELTYSPIIDVKKNVEYLAHFVLTPTPVTDIRAIVKSTEEEHRRVGKASKHR